MPARTRTIGPGVSNQVALAMREARNQKGWTLVRLSQEMAVNGNRISAATLAHVEGFTRWVSVDEVAALIRALGDEFTQDVITILTQGEREK